MTSSKQQRARPTVRMKTEYPLGLTKKAKLLAILPALLAVYMLWLSISAFRSFHPKDSARYTFGLPPLAIALTLVGFAAYIPRKMCRGSINLLESGVEFNPGDHDLNVHLPWNDLLFSATRNPQQMLRSLTLAHRQRTMVFYDIFLPDFDLLVETISRRKSRQVSTNNDGGLKIDSGRIGHIDPRMRGGG
ncbi:hypothetical protein JST97_18155 [bacterium]|nr:hypothetical protein [bacterium]